LGKTPPPQFGALLREFRTTAGLTQEELAERARLSKRGLQDLERGVSRRPRRDTLELLARALQLSGPDREALGAAAGEKCLPPGPAVQAIAPPSGNLVPLVGRRDEVLLLERFLFGERTTFDSTPVLLLAGEPGIGKTRLLQATAQMAVAGGWCVLMGGCFRGDGHGPYAPLLEVLAHYLHAARPARLREVLSGCAWLARLMPELAGAMAHPAGALAADQERRLIYAAVSRFLANVAGPAGTLLVLDDLQWAGPDALDLLAALVRGAGDSVLVVGAYRDTEVEPRDPLGLLCADLAQAQLVRQQTIGPLHQEESSLLLDSLLTGLPRCERGAVEQALQRAGGSPFALVSYAQALREKNTDGVPWNLAQAIRQRVALLSPEGRELLALAATVGRRIPRTLLAAITTQSEEAMLAGLEGACKARLLLEDGDAGYIFAHDVIREVVEGDLGAARRATLHRRVAEAQERACPAPPPETLAYHYAQRDQPDKAIPYLEQAGDRAWNQRSYRSAEQHYWVKLQLAYTKQWSKNLYNIGGRREGSHAEADSPASDQRPTG
jgi:predicted ATPase/DNA-binding XRE family transcriptional regulator